MTSFLTNHVQIPIVERVGCLIGAKRRRAEGPSAGEFWKPGDAPRSSVGGGEIRAAVVPLELWLSLPYRVNHVRSQSPEPQSRGSAGSGSAGREHQRCSRTPGRAEEQFGTKRNHENVSHAASAASQLAALAPCPLLAAPANVMGG